MRFEADGPDIPPELLEARDNGEVVFFCGAGVSMSAGLPDFLRLAQDVITHLSPPADALSRRLLERVSLETEPAFAPPIDQLFGLLQKEYGASLVEDAVSKKLRAPRNANTSCHQIVLRLSTDKGGKALIAGE